MSVVDLALDRARQAVRASGFLGITAAMLPPFVVRERLTPTEEKRAMRDRWLKRWSASLLSLFSVKVEIEGSLPPKSSERGRLVVVNHRSAIDIGVVLGAIGGRMVSRADLAGWPVLGPAARAAGTIFVDRESAQSGVAAIREMQTELKRGETVDIFPEGTTFAEDEIHPFHRGGFIAARAAQAEILPLGLAYEKGSSAAFVNESFMSHLGRMSAARRPTRVVLAIGEPFVATAPAAELTRRAEARVAELVKIARARVDAPR